MNARLPLSGKDLEEYHRHTREEKEAAKQSRWGAVASTLGSPTPVLLCALLLLCSHSHRGYFAIEVGLLSFSHEHGVVL